MSQQQLQLPEQLKKRICVCCKTSHTFRSNHGHESWIKNEEDQWLCIICYFRDRYRLKHAAANFFKAIDRLQRQQLRQKQQQQQQQQQQRLSRRQNSKNGRKTTSLPSRTISWFFKGIEQLVSSSVERNNNNNKKRIRIKKQNNVKVIRTFKNRDSLDILAQILDKISYQRNDIKESENCVNIRFSRLADTISFSNIRYTLGLRYELFKRYIKKLMKYDLLIVMNNVLPKITEKGIRFLRIYREIQDLIVF